MAREAHLGDRIVDDAAVAAASIVGVYLADDGEPDLSAVIAALRAEGIQVALPVLDDDPESFVMQFALWPEGASIVEGRYGIGVPDPTVVCRPDVILVPLVGFDAYGNRVGRGAGFYDRYLANSPATTIGVAFACQQFDSLQPQPHDVALHAVMTEHETLRSDPRRPNGTPWVPQREES